MSPKFLCYDENTIRKDFIPSEAVSIWQAMRDYQGKRKDLQPRSESERGEGKIDKASKLLGLSIDTLSKAKQIVGTTHSVRI